MRILIHLSFLALFVLASLPARADARAEGVAMLALAADLRSSLLRIEERACAFAANGMGEMAALDAEITTLRSHIAVFSGTVTAVGLPAMRAPAVGLEVDLLRARIADVTPYFEAVVVQGGSPAYLAVVADQRAPILRQAERVRGEIARTFMHGRLDLIDSTALAESARLADAAVALRRDLCLGTVALDPAEARLEASSGAFADTLAGLRTGDVGAKLPAPSANMAAALACVTDHFAAFEADPAMASADALVAATTAARDLRIAELVGQNMRFACAAGGATLS